MLREDDKKYRNKLWTKTRIRYTNVCIYTLKKLGEVRDTSKEKFIYVCDERASSKWKVVSGVGRGVVGCSYFWQGRLRRGLTTVGGSPQDKSSHRKLHETRDGFHLCVLLLLLLVLSTTASTASATKTKRALAFKKGSSFFYRMNYKVNTLPSTKIFAYAAGFKVVWQLPESHVDGKRSGRSILDIHDSAELVYESHGFNGKSCLLKNICQALEYVRWKDGVMAKILKFLTGPYINNGTVPGEILCLEDQIKNCPLLLTSINQFSEI
ncbi:uncharacterized protein [Prorops nasuta]|uniref:uncharacterized protein n=1 Tax=Prorops nasuta TaxID=863751 RepID=UPI0034CE05C1